MLGMAHWCLPLWHTLILYPLLLMKLPPGGICLFPLFLLKVSLEAPFHVYFELSAFAGGQLVQLELKDLTPCLVNALFDYLDDSSALICVQKANVVFQSGLFLHCHCLIGQVGALSHNNGISDLRLRPLILALVMWVLLFEILQVVLSL
jgi:hypothetical protein